MEIKNRDLDDKILYISMELQSELKKNGKGFKHRYYRTEDILPTLLKKCVEYNIRFSTVFTHDMAKLFVINKDNKKEKEICQLPIFTSGDGDAEKSVQLAGKIQTYYKRYLIMQMFNICEVDEIEIYPSRQEKIKQLHKKPEPTDKNEQELLSLYEKIRDKCLKFDKCISSQIYAYYDEKLITKNDTDKLLGMYKKEYEHKGGVIM